MDLILHQLGGLVLGSVPTIVLFVLLVMAYGLLVRRPLERVLAERRARTTGAVEQARGAIAAAEAETTVYEDKLRTARAEIFAAREARIKGWAEERERTLEEVSRGTEQQVETARREIEASLGTAKAQIESVGAELSSRILSAVLPAGAREHEVAQ